MRRVFVLAVALSLLTTFSLPHGADSSQRVVLGEFFTNTGCPDCPKAETALDTLVESHPETFITIRYHVWWPDREDPFYKVNAEESTARVNYYDVKYAPHLILDGILSDYDEHAQSMWPGLLIQREQIDSPLVIELIPRYGSVVASIDASQPITVTNLAVHFVLTESEIHYDAPNGISIHDQVMRDMLPDTLGIPIAIHEGETVDVSTRYTIQPNWRAEHCHIVVFVQSDTNKEVLQAAQCEVYYVFFDDFTVIDSEGNGDGKPDPGETVNLVVRIENSGPGATNISGHLSTTDPTLTVVAKDAQYGDIPAWSSGDNANDPFSFTVDESAEPHYANFDLLVVLNDGLDSVTVSFTLVVGHPAVLLVDDASSEVEDVEYYKAPLDNIEGVIDCWRTAQEGSPDSSWLRTYEVVVWFTEGAGATLSPEEQSHLPSYLDQGGRLFISGEDIATHMGSSPFLSDYLHAQLINDDSGELLLSGVPGDVISGSVSLISISGVEGVNTKPDVIAPLSGAMPVFTYYISSEPAALRYAGDHKVVYFAFGFEGIVDFYNAENSPALRAELMQNILDWLRLEFIPQIGDVNEDGQVNIVDVVWLVNIVLGIYEPTPEQEWAADVNEDGTVNIVDAIVLVNIILGPRG